MEAVRLIRRVFGMTPTHNRLLKRPPPGPLQAAVTARML